MVFGAEHNLHRHCYILQVAVAAASLGSDPPPSLPLHLGDGAKASCVRGLLLASPLRPFYCERAFPRVTLPGSGFEDRSETHARKSGDSDFHGGKHEKQHS